MIIMEYLHNGSVDGLIHGKKKNFISFDQRIAMARDCCLGMVRKCCMLTYVERTHG